MSAAEKERLKRLALQACAGETDSERRMAASLLLFALVKATTELERLRARQLMLVPKETP